jgi:hypothetical protein
MKKLRLPRRIMEGALSAQRSPEGPPPRTTFVPVRRENDHRGPVFVAVASQPGDDRIDVVNLKGDVPFAAEGCCPTCGRPC